MPPAEQQSSSLADIASSLLKRRIDHIEKAGAGGNSRIYRVESNKGTYALKIYPIIAGDNRDRLGVERQTLLFFERHGIASVPRWLAGCPGYALLSWVEGELAIPPKNEEIQQAAAFIKDIKRLSTLPDAGNLPAASEACGSGAEILRQIEHRLQRLNAIVPSEPALKIFLVDAFTPLYAKTRNAARDQYAQHGLEFDRPLATGKCLIPADFGFHNAMRCMDGTLTFIDFEYFGWDDPVKLTADFLLHPAVLLTPAQKESFRAAQLATFADDPHFPLRLAALTPLFALRWALILLNEFLPERWSGRASTGNEEQWQQAKERQLGKAYAMLENIA